MIILSCTYYQTYRETFLDHFRNANRTGERASRHLVNHSARRNLTEKQTTIVMEEKKEL
jgi:hypothetical protein